MWIHARYYLFYFAALGLVSPYLGWWLASISPPGQLSYLLGAYQATMILIPSLWGYAAFSGSRPGHWLSHGTLGAAVFALGLSQVPTAGVGAAIFLLLAFGVFFNAILPHAESMVYMAQSGNASRYARIRVFGSFGFLLSSSVLGGLVVMEFPSVFPVLVALLLVATWLSSFGYKGHSPSDNETPQTDTVVPVRSLLRLWPIWTSSFFTQAAFACYYAFFALHMRSIGVSPLGVGVLIGVGVVFEVLAFWKIAAITRWARPWTWIVIAGVVSLVRWVGTGHAESGWGWFVILGVLQTMHAVCFSVFHSSCMALIYSSVPARHNALAQGLNNSAGYGLGGFVGVVVAGQLWAGPGQGFSVFMYAACLSAMGLGLAVLSHKTMKSVA